MVHVLCMSCEHVIMPCVSVHVEVKGQLLEVSSLLPLYLLRTEYWLSGLCAMCYYLLNSLVSQNG